MYAIDTTDLIQKSYHCNSVGSISTSGTKNRWMVDGVVDQNLLNSDISLSVNANNNVVIQQPTQTTSTTTTEVFAPLTLYDNLAEFPLLTQLSSQIGTPETQQTQTPQK